MSENFTFQAQRYLATYPAFIGKTLAPIGFIESEPNPAFCSLVSTDKTFNKNNDISFSPNPVNTLLFLKNNNEKTEQVNLINSIGNLILTQNIPFGATEINVSHLPSGIYFLQNKSSSFLKKIIIQH